MTSNTNIYDLAILGGGPAGIAAGVYAARKKINTLFVTKQFHGQSAVSSDIKNWIGTISIPGLVLAKQMETHLKSYTGEHLTIKEGETAQTIKPEGKNFLITTDQGQYSARAILITTGSHRRKLEIPGAKEFEHKGITYCATCDAPMFSGVDVAVIGGGNAAFESAIQLSSYANKVTIIHRSADFRADKITVQKALEDEKISAIKNVDLLEVEGDKFVTGLKFKNKETGEVSSLPVSGIFVEIGHLPNTELSGDLIPLDENKHIIIDPRTQRTKIEGIWAAGDCTDGLYKQNNIAVGDGVKALEDIYGYLKKM
jgi:alkyl hydroperoxide reductase subunit F